MNLLDLSMNKKQTVKYQHVYDREGDNNRGWILHTINAMTADGKKVGWITVEYIPKDRFAAHYKSVFDFTHKILGSYRSPSKKEFLLFRQFRKYHVDYPIIGYIRVMPEFQRQGIGTQLYIEAGKWMKELGFELHSSLLQSKDAKAIWANMVEQGLAIPAQRRVADRWKQRYKMKV